MGRDISAHAETAAAPIYQPPRAGTTVGVKQRPNRPFLYFAHPNNWHVIAGKLVPQLAEKPLLGGLSGVEATKHGVDPKQMIIAMQDRGYVLVPQDFDGENYVAQTKTTTGQWYYHPRWLRPIAGTDRYTVDVDGFAEFSEKLIGPIVPPPDASLLEQLQEAAITRHSEAEAKARKFPHLQPEAARAAEEVALLLAYGKEPEPEKPEKPEKPENPNRSRRAKDEEAPDVA